MDSISSSSHIRCTINGSTKEYPVALISNKTVVLILLLLPSVHVANNVCSAKKSPGNIDEDTINSKFLPLSTTLTKVQRFPPILRPTLVQLFGLHPASSLASNCLSIQSFYDLFAYT